MTKNIGKVKQILGAVVDVSFDESLPKILNALEINYDKTISIPDFFDHYHHKKKQLSQHMEKWEEMVAELESIIRTDV